jgi:Protein of unknown function (DUF3891)
MLLVPFAEDHVAVAQPAHGWMCGQLARAWGNEQFGAVEPREEVCLAAEQHDTGWADWEQAPTLDIDSGLPHTFKTAPYTVQLAIHAAWSRSLVAQSRYAALLVSMHHASFFERPGPLGRLRDGGRQIRDFLNDLEQLQTQLSTTIGVPDDEIERNRRLVRTWDGISHDLLLGLAPRVRHEVPAHEGLVDLAVGKLGEIHTLDPWPFGLGQVTVRTEGRLLRGRFANEAIMRQALADAPWVELTYELLPVGGA